MSSLGKLVGRVREQLSEIGEAIAGNAADRALEEQIRLADGQLRTWRASLAELKARHLAASERRDADAATILQREAQAAAALQAGEDALALEVAREIDRLELARDDEAALITHLDACIAQLVPLVEQGERHLRRLRHQIDVLHAAQTVQRAQESVAGRACGSVPPPRTAIDSLVRARRRHGAAPIDIDSAGIPSADALDIKLHDAGLDQRARLDAILARIQATAAPVVDSEPARHPRRTP